MERINRSEILTYLLNTQASLEIQYPDYPLKEELDELIAKLTNDEPVVDYLKIVAEKEHQLIAKGVIDDEDGDGVGFFGALKDLFSVGLDGLGRFSWSSVKNKVGNVIQKINRVNPTTIVARNSLRTLISINIFGYATSINKSEEVKRKVLDLYRRLGGKVENMKRAIEEGAKKRPIFARKGQVNGLGTDVSVLLQQAQQFLGQIKAWVNEAILREKQAKLQAIIELMQMNIYGYASVINRNSQLKSRVLNLYRSMGGNTSLLEQAINRGANKTAYHPKKTIVKNPVYNHIDRAAPTPRPELMRGLGEPISISAMLASAGAFLAKIKDWIKEAGIKINVGTRTDNFSKTSQTSQEPAQHNNPPKVPSKGYIPVPPTTVPTQPDTPQTKASVNVGGSNKLVKVGLSLVIGTAMTVGGFKLVQLINAKKQNTLKGITLK